MKTQLELISEELPFFRNIVHRNLPPRYHYLAEDIAQDSIVKAIENLPKYDSHKGNFKSWLYRITQNICFDHYRKLERMQTVPLQADIYRIQEENRSLNRKDIKLARKALRFLCERDRDLIIYRIMFGMTTKEIASLMDIPENHVNVYFKRAKSRWQKYFTSAA